MKKLNVINPEITVTSCNLFLQLRGATHETITDSDWQIMCKWNSKMNGASENIPLTEQEFNRINNSIMESWQVFARGNASLSYEQILANAEATMQAELDQVKVIEGETPEDFKNRADKGLTGHKNAFCAVLDALDPILGTKALKEEIEQLLYDNTGTATTKKSLQQVAKDLRDLVQNYIDMKSLVSADDNFTEVIALQKLLGQDTNGNKIYGTRSIIDAFIDGVVWIGKKVSRCFKKWFPNDPNTNPFGAIGASISAIFGAAIGLAISAIKLAFSVILWIGSYVFGAVIKAIAFVSNSIGGWAQKAADKFNKKDAKEDKEEDAKDKNKETK